MAPETTNPVDEYFPYASPDPAVNPLLAHRGHRIEIATYGPAAAPVNAAVECTECCAVIFDADIETA